MRDSKIAKLLLFILLALLLLGTSYRLVKRFTEDFYVDFYSYKIVAEALVSGDNPYDAQNYHILDRKWPEPPISFYPSFLLIYPFMLLGSWSTICFLAVSLVALFAFYYLLYKKLHTHLPEGWQKSHLFTLCALLFIVNAFPVQTTLRNGQIILIYSLILGSLLIIHNNILRGLIAGLLFLLKLSTGWIFILFSAIYNPKVFFISTTVVIAGMMSPFLFGSDPFEILSAYYKLVVHSTTEGLNQFSDFSGGGHTIISLGFIKYYPLKSLLYVCLTLLLARMIFFIRCPAKYSMSIMIAYSSALLFVYHRSYDLTFVLFFLPFLLGNFVKQKQYLCTAITLLFGAYFSLPMRSVFWLEAQLGDLVGTNPLFYISSVHHKPYLFYPRIFPLQALLTLLLTLFLFAVFFFKKNILDSQPSDANC